MAAEPGGRAFGGTVLRHLPHQAEVEPGGVRAVEDGDLGLEPEPFRIRRGVEDEEAAARVAPQVPGPQPRLGPGAPDPAVDDPDAHPSRVRRAVGPQRHHRRAGVPIDEGGHPLVHRAMLPPPRPAICHGPAHGPCRRDLPRLGTAGHAVATPPAPLWLMALAIFWGEIPPLFGGPGRDKTARSAGSVP